MTGAVVLLLVGCPGVTLHEAAPEADAARTSTRDTLALDSGGDAAGERDATTDLGESAPDSGDDPPPDSGPDGEAPDNECEETNVLPDALAGDLLLSVARPTEIISPGLGYDTLAGEVLHLCVSGAIATSGAQDVVFEFRQLEDRAAFAEALGIGVDVSIGFLGWGFENHFRLARSRNVSSYDLNVWVRVRVVSGSEALVADAAILPQHVELLETAPLEFAERCGDRFVQSVTFGGELLILMSIETRSEEDRSDLENTLSASFGIFGSLGVDVESRFSEGLEDREVSIEVTRLGGGGALPALTSIDEVLDYASQFPEQVAAGAPVPIEFTSRPYDRIHAGEVCLPGFDEKSIGLISDAWDVLNEAIGVRNGLLEALEEPDAYACGSNSTRRASLETVEEFIEAIEFAARECARAMAASDRSVTTSECAELERLMAETVLPPLPLRWQVRRTFAAPPTSPSQSLAIPDSEVCEQISADGVWSRWGSDNNCAPDLCWEACPDGRVDDGEFSVRFEETLNEDNRGVCTYTLGCFHEEDAYLVESCRALDCDGPIDCDGTCVAPRPAPLEERIHASTATGRHRLSGGCAASRAAELVYAIDAPEGLYCADLVADHDTVLHIRRGDCANSSLEIACNDDVDGSTNSRLEFSITGPTTHYLVVDGYQADDSGEFELLVRSGACR